MAVLISDWLTNFELRLKNYWRDLLQTCHKCSLWAPDQVLFLFMSIRNLVWPPWPLIGWHILNFFSTAEGIYSKLATAVPDEVLTKWCYFLGRSKSNLAALASDWLTHFQLLLKNGWRDLLQSCHKCSWWGPDQVLLLFKSIWNPIWPPWPLIGWHIFNIFSRTAEGIYSKLATNYPYDFLTKCC